MLLKSKVKSDPKFLWLILVLVLCFIVRAGYISIQRERLNELVISDMRTYDLLARNLIEKGYYGISSPWSYRPPLYPFFISLVYRVSGTNYPVARLTQAALAVFSCLLLFALGRWISDLRVGLMAAFLFSIDFSLIHTSGLFLSENLYIPLSLLLIWLLAKSFQSSSIAFSFSAGFIGGLAALCRPVVLPFLILAGLVPILLKSGSHLKKSSMDGNSSNPGSGLTDRWFLKWVIILLMASLTISPWTIRNYLLHQSFVPISTNGGVMFWMGLHHGAPGDYHFPKENNPLYRITDEVERNRVGYREAVKFILHSPGECVKLAGKKMAQFWGAYLSTGSGKEWLIFMLLGAAGLIISLWEWRKWLIIYIYVASFASVHLLAHSGYRYRFSLHPLIELWAALFLIRLWDKGKSLLISKKGQRRS